MYAFYYNFANAWRDAIVLTFPSALVLFCLYMKRYEVKHCKTLVLYSFACQYCNDSFAIVFSYPEPHHTRVHTCIFDTGLFLRTFELVNKVLRFVLTCVFGEMCAYLDRTRA